MASSVFDKYRIVLLASEGCLNRDSVDFLLPVTFPYDTDGLIVIYIKVREVNFPARQLVSATMAQPSG
jgi:hypothetical protein